MRRSAALATRLLAPGRLLGWPLAFALVLAFALGCGYALTGSGLEGAGTIAIRTPENGSQEPGVGVLMADALRRELLRRSRTALGEDPARADLVVSGRVLRVRSQARSFSSAVLAREYEITLEVALDAVRRDGSMLLPESTRLSESERYLASADIEAQRKNRNEALRRVSGLLAARFFDRIGYALP